MDREGKYFKKNNFVEKENFEKKTTPTSVKIKDTLYIINLPWPTTISQARYNT